MVPKEKLQPCEILDREREAGGPEGSGGNSIETAWKESWKAGKLRSERSVGAKACEKPERVLLASEPGDRGGTFAAECRRPELQLP